MEKKEIIRLLANNGLRHISIKRDGTIRAMVPYFYRPTGTPDQRLEQKVLEVFPDCEVISKGDFWAAFKGGAPISKQSHIYCEFKLKS